MSVLEDFLFRVLTSKLFWVVTGLVIDILIIIYNVFIMTPKITIKQWLSLRKTTANKKQCVDLRKSTAKEKRQYDIIVKRIAHCIKLVLQFSIAYGSCAAVGYFMATGSEDEAMASMLAEVVAPFAIIFIEALIDD